MDIKSLTQLYPLQLPISKNGIFWNGRPDEFSNIGGNLNYSQKYGLTPYAKTGIYGYINGKPKIHNGHDFAGKGIINLVFPLKAWVSYIGFDKKGYGNFIFFETETKTINGETVKMEFVLAHFDRIITKKYKWYNIGDIIGIMGSTGMSSGQHTHFGGRPLIRQVNGSWMYIFPKNRGYIDLTPFFINKPIYDKQKLINQNKFMRDFEKKIIIEGEGIGRKGIIINGKLREIKKGREADACLYTLANNGLGITINSEAFDLIEKDKDF